MADNHELRIYDSIIGLLSNEQNPTPLVRLNKVVGFNHTRVYAKLEWYNPFGAVKDRVAANLIQDAQERGELVDGKRMVEPTSGNTGLGLAMMGNILGIPLRTPLSSDIPLEKRTVLRMFGSDVLELNDTLCPAPGAPEGAIAKAKEIARSEDAFVMLNQYENQANPQSHYKTTGPEIWRQTGGLVTHFVAGLGTCGTITGTGRFLKEKNNAVQVIGIHPEDGHDIPGVRSLRQLAQTQFFLPDEYDQVLEVTNRESFDMGLRLNREESIIAGPSSGMALAGALKTVPDAEGNIVVVIFPDDVFKYASSFQRHFPGICPPQDSSQDNGASKNDQMMTTLIENLKNPYDSVRVKDLKKELDGDQLPKLVDVRPPEMFAKSHLAGSVNIPEEDLPDRVEELPADRDAPIVMICGIGKFSKHTVLYLKSLGYRNARSMKGGVNEWVRKGLPVQTTEDE